MAAQRRNTPQKRRAAFGRLPVREVEKTIDAKLPGVGEMLWEQTAYGLIVRIRLDSLDSVSAKDSKALASSLEQILGTRVRVRVSRGSGKSKRKGTTHNDPEKDPPRKTTQGNPYTQPVVRPPLKTPGSPNPGRIDFLIESLKQ